MNIVAAIRRFFGFHGEGLLAAATADLDKVAAKLEDAADRLDAEYNTEVASITAARRKHSEREFQSRQVITGLSGSRARVLRVSGKIADLLS